MNWYNTAFLVISSLQVYVWFDAYFVLNFLLLFHYLIWKKYFSFNKVYIRYFAHVRKRLSDENIIQNDIFMYSCYRAFKLKILAIHATISLHGKFTNKGWLKCAYPMWKVRVCTRSDNAFFISKLDPFPVHLHLG